MKYYYVGCRNTKNGEIMSVVREKCWGLAK